MKVVINLQRHIESSEINTSKVVAGCPTLAQSKHSKNIYWGRRELQGLKKRKRHNVQFAFSSAFR